jgi:hypothetical protein
MIEILIETHTLYFEDLFEITIITIFNYIYIYMIEILIKTHTHVYFEDLMDQTHTFIEEWVFWEGGLPLGRIVKPKIQVAILYIYIYIYILIGLIPL